MPQLFRKIRELRSFIKTVRCEGNSRTIGFVPTMGYLHEGHAELIKLSKLQNDITVVSIYVNPLQFGEGEDFQRYPRDLDRDLALCGELGVDIVFAPTDEEMYPQKPQVRIEIPGLTDILEGAFRPGHFNGVAIVVLKLLHILQPDRVYFGEKDYQQLKVVQRLVEDLSVQVEVVPVPTVRDKDGLALSSRNTYLTQEERESALSIYRSFLLAQRLFSGGNRDPQVIISAVKDFISKHPHVKKIDYVDIRDEELRPVEKVEEGHRLLVAVWVGTTRLIDNWRFSHEEV
ncbi:pantoate/beta-alanine ligase [Thermocrinis albus DSM 14484]|uniref:Pantothenate synthetase n=1 Tax=Thermocrinis albus (strain DSM 14484 / JCM 11386 / HI 11/12) TaxID=638303 RepID=D3SMB7_THEAH|nr:pantoate--beta-alanine ligase [Thermocrinis albus]ADC89897.1 pantoate/beta-alanine ligase [Thermocrinis albus DSM 14484]